MAEYLICSNPKDYSVDYYRAKFKDYLQKYETEAMLQILLQSAGTRNEPISLPINLFDVTHFDSAIGFLIVHFPKLLIPRFNESVLEYQSTIYHNDVFQQKYKDVANLKSNLSVRLHSLPPLNGIVKTTISDIRSHEVNTLIQITGTITRSGGVKMLELSRRYECQNPKCRYQFTVQADAEQDYMLPIPQHCPRRFMTGTIDSDGKQPSKCNSTLLREIEHSKCCVDYQEIKVQDHIERVSFGRVPRSIIVILEADLVDKFNPGDDVVIVGELIRQWRKSPAVGVRCNLDMVIHANSIISLYANDATKMTSVLPTINRIESFWKYYKERNEEFVARNLILKTVCPQLYGLFYLKLSLLLTIIGGSTTISDNGVKRRSQSHMLIIGDPGCGKSQLLRFAASLVPRSVITTGIGTTGAGLTCTAVKDGNDWSLEAGAMVLANDGVCAIDEFAAIREQDRATIHEAMEQQTLSIAKAGLVVKLHTRTTVIACCNPKGSFFDVTSNLTANTAIAAPLLSRFDIICLLRDVPDKEWDKRVSTFLLKQAIGNIDDIEGDQHQAPLKEHQSNPWDVDQLKQYITLIRHRKQPKMTDQSRYLLTRYYQLQRQSDDRNSSRTTVRLLESLVRLSEAHAKLMYHDEVQIEDAVIAIVCVSLSESQKSLLERDAPALQEDFPEHPEQHYRDQEARIFRLLHCTQESIAKEVSRTESISQIVNKNPTELPVEGIHEIAIGSQRTTRVDQMESHDRGIATRIVSSSINEIKTVFDENKRQKISASVTRRQSINKDINDDSLKLWVGTQDQNVMYDSNIDDINSQSKYVEKQNSKDVKINKRSQDYSKRKFFDSINQKLMADCTVPRSFLNEDS